MSIHLLDVGKVYFIIEENKSWLDLELEWVNGNSGRIETT